VTDIPRRTTCRVCGSADLAALFSLGDQFVSDFVPFRKINAGVRCPINLQLCARCELVQAEYTAPQELLYSRHYWYRSNVTQTMRDALRDVALSAQRLVPLSPWDVVIDIGSNTGDLLRNYPSNVVTVGIEPAKNLAKEGSRGIDVFVNDFWGIESYERELAKFVGGRDRQVDGAKIITACGMFYDLEDPNQFIRDVAAALHQDGLFVAQLMCLKNMIDMNDVGNLCHEHLEFYSLQSLQYLYEKHGLEIFDVETNAVNGQSYRIFARTKRSRLKVPPGCTDRVFEAMRIEERELGNHLKLREWFNGLEENKRKVVDFVNLCNANGKSVAIFGASTKGNVIAQWMNLTPFQIQFAMDRSPEKAGLYMAGTGIPVVSEEEGRSRLPDFALVMPYGFKNEFIERESNQEWRKRGGRFIFPLPKFEVV